MNQKEVVFRVITCFLLVPKVSCRETFQWHSAKVFLYGCFLKALYGMIVAFEQFSFVIMK